MFFASAKRYSEVIEEIGIKSKLLIIRMRHVSFIDQTGIMNLKSTLNILKNKGVKVILSGVNQEVMKDFDKSQLTDQIGKINICNSFDKAVFLAKEETNI